MHSAIVFSTLLIAALAAPSPTEEKKLFRSMDWDRYWSLEEIYTYLDELQAASPGISQVEHMGTSSGGVQIRGMRIANEEHLGTEQLPIIFVTAGTSARDWISTMAALNIIHTLIENYEDFRPIVDNVEWFVIPVSNPDGYEFSRTAGQRAWIKNRNTNPGSECIGVNIERNFEFNWGLDIASSNDPCSSNFRGPLGDSEEETKTIQFANDIFRRLQQTYITIRAGSIATHSIVAIPYSSNNEWFAPNFHDQLSQANIMADTIWRETGARYRITSEANAAGFVSGTSGDYALGQDHVPFVYTIFAPSAGPNGWDVPEGEINRIVDEIFAGIRVHAEHIETLGVPGRQ